MSYDKGDHPTTILNKYPSYRDDKINGNWKWLDGRRKDDNAEGLWRVHNKLYDISSFIEKHPGGREWLELTEGTDITEAFETYHITSDAKAVLAKYFVSDAKEPRNYKFTYDENGFFRTLKRRVATKLETIDRDGTWDSKFYFDLVLTLLFVSSIISIRTEVLWSRILSILIAGQCAAWLNTLSHNFIHQRNSWRMYGANIVLVGWRDWRVFHGMSHHLFPNSYADLEISLYEPSLRWIPIQKRTKFDVWFSYVFSPIAYGALFYNSMALRILGLIYSKHQRFHWDELMFLLIPLSMFLFGNPSLTLRNLVTILIVWNLIIIVGGFLYSVMAISAGHHNTTNIHEGDEFKSLDYGIYQLGATIDRTEAQTNLFISLTHFGDHTLHHLFPSLDHAILPHLRGTLIETCQEFKYELQQCSLWEAFVGQFEQLGRTETIKLL